MSDEPQAEAPSIDASLDRAMAAISPDDHEGNAPQALRSGNGDNSRLSVYERMEAEGKGKDGKAKDGKPVSPKVARDLQKRADRDGIDDALDVATGKKEKAARADKDESFKTDKDGKPRIYSAKGGEDAQLLDGIIDRAQGKAADKKAPFDRREFAKPEVRAVRDELKARYPNAKLSDHLKAMEHWHGEFQKDPVGAREKIMEAYLNVSPQGFAKYEPKAGKATDPKYAQGEAIDRATADASDLEDVKAYAEKFGADLPSFIRQFLEFDKGMVDDPVGTSARLAANYGALRPEPAQQVQQPAQQANQPVKPIHERTPQEDQDNVFQAVDLLVKHCADPSVGMPGINDDVLNAMADALGDGRVPRTGDRMGDLRAAYDVVMGGRQQHESQTAERARRGGKSISGGYVPSYGGSTRAARGSIDASLDRAFGRV